MKPEIFTFNEALSVERHRLPNGLTLLALPDPEAEILSYQSWFKVGSAWDPPGQTGMAHLLEHLMFKGTPRHPAGALDAKVSAVGGRTNAATGLDWTLYYQDIPHDALELLVELEADRAVHLSLESTQVEAERQVVLQERLERVENHPDGLLGELLWGAAFEAQPYGAPTVGLTPHIEGISAEALRAFYRAHYAPNRLTLVLSGRVTPEGLEGLLERYSALIPQPAPSTPPPSPGHWATGPRRVERALALPVERLLIGLGAVEVTHPLHPALEILNELLFEGESSRAQRALVSETEMAMSVYGFPPSFREAGLYEIGVDMRAGLEAERAEEALLGVLARLRRDGVDAEELLRAKNKLLVRFYRGLQTHKQRAQSAGFWEMMGGFEALFERGARYAGVGADEVMAALDALTVEGRVVVIGRVEGDR